MWVMKIMFFVPLTMIALYESQIAPSKRLANLFPANDVDQAGESDFFS